VGRKIFDSISVSVDKRKSKKESTNTLSSWAYCRDGRIAKAFRVDQQVQSGKKQKRKKQKKQQKVQHRSN
jgi:hypothetical protein